MDATDESEGTAQLINSMIVPNDCWGQHEPTLTAYSCPGKVFNGTQVTGCGIRGWIDDGQVSGFSIIPFAEGVARFTFEFECTAPLVSTFTYELDFNCCFGVDCALGDVQATGHVAADGTVVFVKDVRIMIFCLVCTVLGIVGASLMVCIGKAMERQNEVDLEKLLKRHPQLTQVQRQIEADTISISILTTIFLVGLCMVSLCVFAVVRSSEK